MAQTQEESEQTMARLISSEGCLASVSELCEVVITRAGPRLALRVRPVPGRGPPGRQRAQLHPGPVDLPMAEPGV
jgi:hypothetical protein